MEYTGGGVDVDVEVLQVMILMWGALYMVVI